MVFFLVLLGAASFSQTAASLATVSTSPGETVSVPLDVTGFTGIGSITFHIQYDPAVMTYTGFSLPSGSPGGFVVGPTGNFIDIVGSWSSFANFGISGSGTGNLLILNFTYNGMTPSPLNFHGTCEVTRGLTVIYPTYTDGSVSMAIVSQKATLISATALPVPTGSNVDVPIEYTGFTDKIGAITQKIHYDPTKLNFVKVTGYGNLTSGINYTTNISTGIITITWTNTSGAYINTNGIPVSKFVLTFVYIGNTVTNVDFVAGCIISKILPVGENVPVTYYGTTVSPGYTTITAKLGSIPNAQQDQDYNIPMTLTGFPIGPYGGTQAFTLTIPFDNTKLSYLGLVAPVAGLVVSQASGTLVLAWSNSLGPDINGVFLQLKFKYRGVGVAAIDFGNGCVFNTNNGGTLSTVQVVYTNATVTPAIASASATIGKNTGVAPGVQVNVPINFVGLPVGMGAVTLFISYDYNRLVFIDAQNNTHGANVNLIGSTHIIKIAWNALSATDINGKFLDLRFSFIGGGGCGAAVNFVDGCELANFGGAIVPVNWINGGVDLIKVSGTLKYNSDDALGRVRIPLKGFTVNLKSDPGNVTVGTAITNANGEYEIWAPTGTYKLEAAAAPAEYDWVADMDDVLAMFDKTMGYSIPFENPLRLTAGDVNMTGDIEFEDVLAVFDKMNQFFNPDYLAPDWVFENPTITINCADVPNQDFMGLNSGDVLGNNTQPCH